MREIQSCIGLPLIGFDDAEQVGVATHFLSDPVHNRIVGLVISAESRLIGKKACLFSDVMEFGPDLILLHAAGAVRPLSTHAELQPFLNLHRDPLYRQAWTSDGQRLGRFTAHSFDERSAQVLSFLLEPYDEEPFVVPHDALASSGKALALFRREALPLPFHLSTSTAVFVSPSPALSLPEADPVPVIKMDPVPVIKMDPVPVEAPPVPVEAPPVPVEAPPVPVETTTVAIETTTVPVEPPPIIPATASVVDPADLINAAPAPDALSRPDETPYFPLMLDLSPSPSESLLAESHPAESHPAESHPAESHPAPVDMEPAFEEAAPLTAAPIDPKADSEPVCSGFSTEPFDRSSVREREENGPMTVADTLAEVIRLEEALSQGAPEQNRNVTFSSPTPEIAVPVPPEAHPPAQVAASSSESARSANSVSPAQEEFLPVPESPVAFSSPIPSCVMPEFPSEAMEADEELERLFAMESVALPEEISGDIREEPAVFTPAPPEHQKMRDLFHGNKDEILPLVIGKFSDREITDRDGDPIVIEGQQISRKVAEMAWRNSKLYDLFLAAQPMGPHASM
ncbi:MAG: hypothetical protein KY468_08415 [Armatimonadetes bacterium]|nr:hypothetical protein [Armatimonadota bacterium]